MPNTEVPMSEMVKDWLTTYKYGWKTSYYQNTYDMSTDTGETDTKDELESLLSQIELLEEDDCDSCKI